VSDRDDAKREKAISWLADFWESVDPCEHGHVEHDAEAHRGRHLIHSMSGPFGADWDYGEAVGFIRAAEAVAVSSPGRGMGHRVRALGDGRYIAFETRRDVDDDDFYDEMAVAS
jgi:hypothetical protein